MGKQFGWNDIKEFMSRGDVQREILDENVPKLSTLEYSLIDERLGYLRRRGITMSKNEFRSLALRGYEEGES